MPMPRGPTLLAPTDGAAHGGPTCNIEAENAWANYNKGESNAPLHHSIKPGGPPDGFGKKDGFGNREGFGRSRQFDFKGNRLDEINWKGEMIVPVRKDFYMLHPSVEARSWEECDKVRLRYGIEVECWKRLEGGIPKPVENLEELPFPDWATTVLRERSWKGPTAIQVQTWPAALQGLDVVGVAATGSGKTMAYVLPMLVHIMAQPELKPGEGPVGLVLLPTRELCSQVRDEIVIFGQYTQLKCESVHGGEECFKQANRFLERVDIVTTTPARMLDLLTKGTTNLRRVTYVVVDEADELLEKKNADHINHIMSQIRPDRQVLLFSATFQDNVKEFAKQVCENQHGHSSGTLQVNVGGIKLSACKDIDQQFWAPGRCQNNEWPAGETKQQVLCRALQFIGPMLQSGDSKALVFCNHSSAVPNIVGEVRRAGIACEGFTGELVQTAREEVLQRFRAPGSDLPLLVCTNILGRGHDFHNVKYVVNFDMPGKLVEYIHRIGRTGRQGQQGFSLTLLEEIDLRFAKELVECLQETGHRVPMWLEQDAKKSKRLWRQFREQFWGTSATAGEGGGDATGRNAWVGRGEGRRHLFLAELNGLGLARACA